MTAFLIFVYIAASYLRPFDNPAWASLRPMFALGLVAFLGSLVAAVSGRFTFRAPQFYLGMGFVASAVLSMLAQRWFGGAIQAILTLQTSVGLFYIVAWGIHSLKALRAMAIVLILVSLFLTFEGLAAYYFGYDAPTLLLQEQIDGPDGQLQPLIRVRSRGILNDPNDLAQQLLTTLPLLWIAWRRGNPARNFILVLLPASVLLYGAYLTRSRGGLVTVAALCFLAIRTRVGRLGRALMALGLVIALPIVNFAGRSITLQDGAARSRVESWSQGLEMFRASPVFGAGFGFYTDHAERTAHNSFVLCFAELGIVGYFFWTALLIISIVELRSIVKMTGDHPLLPELQRWATILQITLYAFCAAALFLSRTYIVTLYVLLGMVVVVVEVARRAGLPVFRIQWANFCSKVFAFDIASIIAIYTFIRVGVR